MKRFDDTEYNRLRETPRFQKVSTTFMGRALKVPDAASLLFLNRELFDLEIYKFESRSSEPIIIDAGANVGLSIIYFKELYPDSKITAFEPDYKVFDYLKYNVKMFGYSDVELINKGLWDEEATLHFFSEGADGGRISDDEHDGHIINIETTKLSNYIKERQIDFLKMDIEGAETKVLRECCKYLSNVANIYIEYHSDSKEEQTLSEILSILTKSGFRYYIEHIGVKSPHPFVKINVASGFDSQLHIWGYR